MSELISDEDGRRCNFGACYLGEFVQAWAQMCFSAEMYVVSESCLGALPFSRIHIQSSHPTSFRVQGGVERTPCDGDESNLSKLATSSAAAAMISHRCRGGWLLCASQGCKEGSRGSNGPDWLAVRTW